MAAGRQDGVYWARVGVDNGPGIASVAIQRARRDGTVRTVQRMAAYAAGGPRRGDLRAAADALRAADRLGFGRLLADQRAAWARRWDAVDIQVRGDPEAQLALRFALFQLWCATRPRGELAVGARGLSGTGYAGHVFWDADVFMLPAAAAMDPAAAGAMVRYRLRPVPRPLAITGASHVTGWLPPLPEIIAAAHHRGIPVLVDAARLAPHRPLPAEADFLAWSGHKMYAPFGA